jgi:hypothetical protein
MTALIIASPSADATQSGEGPADKQAAKKPLALAASVLPAEIVDSMQDARYDEAGRLLSALSEKTNSTDDKAYFYYVAAISQRLGGHRDAARELLRKADAADPKGRWIIKIRYELAGIELSAGNWAPAEDLARAEAERLLSGDRKDQLAGIYDGYARRLLDTGDPLIPPDPNAAYDLLVQARELAESPPLRARLLFAMGKASMAANNTARAIENFGLYVQDYPAGADQLTVRFQLGDAQQKANQPLVARRIWTDLAREIERMPAGQLSKEASALRADALYSIASTYGIPNPPDDTSLNRGVAAIRRFLSAYPAHA